MKGDYIMSDVKCTVTNCYYNKRTGCTAPTITVDGRNAVESRSTKCDTFIEQKPGMQSSVSQPNSDMDVRCTAMKCVYNDLERCEATDILINGKNAKVPEETCCSTFRE